MIEWYHCALMNLELRSQNGCCCCCCCGLFNFFYRLLWRDTKKESRASNLSGEEGDSFLLSGQSLRSVIKKSKANFIAFKQKKSISLSFFKCDDNHLLIWDCKNPKILLNSRENFYLVKKSGTLTIEDINTLRWSQDFFFWKKNYTQYEKTFFFKTHKKRCRDGRDIVHLDKPKLTLLKIVLRKQLRLFSLPLLLLCFTEFPIIKRLIRSTLFCALAKKWQLDRFWRVWQ